jgi:hypothetical protein
MPRAAILASVLHGLASNPSFPLTSRFSQAYRNAAIITQCFTLTSIMHLSDRNMSDGRAGIDSRSCLQMQVPCPRSKSTIPYCVTQGLLRSCPGADANVCGFEPTTSSTSENVIDHLRSRERVVRFPGAPLEARDVPSNGNDSGTVDPRSRSSPDHTLRLRVHAARRCRAYQRCHSGSTSSLLVRRWTVAQCRAP